MPIVEACLFLAFLSALGALNLRLANVHPDEYDRLGRPSLARHRARPLRYATWLLAFGFCRLDDGTSRALGLLAIASLIGFWATLGLDIWWGHAAASR